MMKLLKKIWFLNIKMSVVFVVAGNMYVAFHFFIIQPFLRKYLNVGGGFLFWPINCFLFAFNILLILFVIGFIGKVVYSKRQIKCEGCGQISSADKWFCSECGKRLLDDGWIKLK